MLPCKILNQKLEVVAAQEAEYFLIDLNVIRGGPHLLFIVIIYYLKDSLGELTCGFVNDADVIIAAVLICIVLVFKWLTFQGSPLQKVLLSYKQD